MSLRPAARKEARTQRPGTSGLRKKVRSFASPVMSRRLRGRLSELPGCRAGAFAVASADEFAYTDPVDGSITERQGVRIELDGGSRIVYRLSGTGTEGATLRVYLERFEPDPARHRDTPDAVLTPLADIPGMLGRTRPDVAA